ncbi:Carbohydrate binding domain protein [Pelomyxa schiedti]|nr:Carbohydrate binding domain protein [Pelomyxa schiedti]
MVDLRMGYNRGPGSISAKLEFNGTSDSAWEIAPSVELPVTPGEKYFVQGWFKGHSANAFIGFSFTIKYSNGTYNWGYTRYDARSWAENWTMAQTWFIVPADVTALNVLVAGAGLGIFWVDDLYLAYNGTVPVSISLSSTELSLVLSVPEAIFRVKDNRNGIQYIQPVDTLFSFPRCIGVFSYTSTEAHILVQTFDIFEPFNLSIVLFQDQLILNISGNPTDIFNDDSAEYPPTFSLTSDQNLVLAYGEGLTFHADDPDATLIWDSLSHPKCASMPWWAVVDSTSRGPGYLAIVDTPNDAVLWPITDTSGLSFVVVSWVPQLGMWGYSRKMRYIFLETGGYVEACKRYAELRPELLVNTLKSKITSNANTELTIGTPEVWLECDNATATAIEIQSAGMTTFKWSWGTWLDSETVNQLAGLHGVLPSKFDMYHQVMDPATWGVLEWTNPCWIAEAYPYDIILDKNQNPVHLWSVPAANGTLYNTSLLCDLYSLNFSKDRIAHELPLYPFKGRLDGDLAAEWFECYNVSHTTTRTQSKKERLAVLENMKNSGYVTGSEGMFEDAVPDASYFFGMSMAFLLEDYDTFMIFQDPPTIVEKFTVGFEYRLPLWELVYHNTAANHWHFNDANNRFLSIWRKRDLFNILYGTAPTYSMNETFWKANTEKFLSSYNSIVDVTKLVAHAQMVDHLYLKVGRDVQQTLWEDGNVTISIIVNFNETAVYGLGGSPGVIMPPLSSVVTCDYPPVCIVGVIQGSACEESLALGYCLIDNVCYVEGQLNPVSQCKACVTASSTQVWTPISCSDPVLISSILLSNPDWDVLPTDFEAMFISDLATAMAIPPHTINVTNITTSHPAVRELLIQTEFSIEIFEAGFETEDDCIITLTTVVMDEDSQLYQGNVTCYTESDSLVIIGVYQESESMTIISIVTSLSSSEVAQDSVSDVSCASLVESFFILVFLPCFVMYFSKSSAL